MKGCRKCSDGSNRDLLQYDSVRHMAAVSKGARKIMTEIPDQLTSVFTWTVFAGACIIILVTVTCLVLMCEPCNEKNVTYVSPNPAHRIANVSPDPAHHDAAGGPVAVTRELCPFKGPRRLRRHVPSSELMALDIGADDVHLVFTPHDAYVPWSYACSLESALRAAGNGSRVNVFVVHGVGGREHGQNNGPSPVLLSSTLADLTKTYGAVADDGRSRLNEVHVDLDECLLYTPLRGMRMRESSGEMSPEMAVQLAVLWQFGGTALDAGTVAVRGKVHQASGTAVEYGDRTVSSPAACHAFVYDMLSHARDLVRAHDRWPYEPITAGTLADGTVRRTGRVAGQDARRATVGLECGPAVGGRDDCFYEWCPADRAVFDTTVDVLSSCPVISGSVDADRVHRANN